MTEVLKTHPNIESVWLLSPDGSFQPPRIAVMGALHGNERCGLAAIERVRADAENFASRMRRGTLVLIHGNPLATEQGKRFSRGGVDINRLFAYEYLHDLAQAAWTYEHHRAAAIRPVVTDVDALIDLHSASRPTDPFAICDGTPEGIKLAQSTGCNITYGWDGPGMLMEHVSIGALVAAGKPALSIECGQHADPGAADIAHRILCHFLGALGVTDHGVADETRATYRLFGRVVKPTHDFQLAGPFKSFDRLAPGEKLGSGDGVIIHTEQEAHLLLPTPTAVRGEDIVYLARKE